MPDGDVSLQIHVLGPLRVLRGTTALDPGAAKQRAVLGALALRRDRDVSVDGLTDLLWGDDPPGDAVGTLQVYVSGLRRALEPEWRSRARPQVLLRTESGYRLRVDGSAVDAVAFTDAVLAAHEAVTAGFGDGPPDGTPSDRTATAALAARLESALALWRGTPFAELGDAPAVAAERRRLEELRLLAVEDLAAVRLALGAHQVVVAALAAETEAHPLRERLWALRIAALARSQRQADALAALRTVTGRLREELGVEPGPVLARLMAAILRQDDEALRPAAPRPTLTTPAVALLGREAELALLRPLLDRTSPGFALVVGEAGIGKSTLLTRLAEEAAAAGRTVLVGRAAEDDGAPPLWPWTGITRGVGALVPLAKLLAEAGLAPDGLPEWLAGAPEQPTARTVPGAGSSDRFRVFDAMTRVVAAAARRQPLLVVLEDLHWADPTSLRLLRYLVEAVEGDVAVVGSLRPQSEPDGALAEALEAFARRGAARVELAGLDLAATASLARKLSGEDWSDARIRMLRSRSAGNPFFVTELVRLGEGPDAVPSAVGDVVRRRVDRLPEQDRALLRVAAIGGLDIEPAVLAAVADVDEDAVLDTLERAAEGGLVVEAAADHFRFAHALTRDAVYAQSSATRRARWHARYAEALAPLAAASADRLSDLARHGLLAGPQHAGQAWRWARDAAAYAEQLHAHEEAAALLRSAIDAQRRDPEATRADRSALWRARADACRRAADWVGLTAALHEALRLARQQGDLDGETEAAVLATEGSLWLPRPYGLIDPETVAALHHLLEALPAGDDPRRCRALMALSAELHYVPGGRAHRESLAAEGVAMSRRLGDPALIGQACRIASVSTWWAGNPEERWDLLDEAVRLAEATADEDAYAAALVLRAAAASETTRLEALRDDGAHARSLAERLRLPYHLTVLGTVECAWLGMRGRFQEAEELVERTSALAESTAVTFRTEVLVSTVMSLRLWQGRAAEIVPYVEGMLEDVDTTRTVTGTTPIDPFLLLLRLRAGALDAARRQLAAVPLDFATEDFVAYFRAAVAIEAGLLLDLPDLAAAGVARIAHRSGTLLSAGSGVALGPVDAFLAIGAAVAGDRDAYRRHARRTAELCEAWGLGLVLAWFEGLGLERRLRAA